MQRFDDLLLMRRRSWRDYLPDLDLLQGLSGIIAFLVVLGLFLYGFPRHEQAQCLLEFEGYTNIETFGWCGPRGTCFTATKAGFRIWGEVRDGAVHTHRLRSL